MGKTLRKCVLSEYNEPVKMHECVRAYRCPQCQDDYAEVVKKGKPKKRKCPECSSILEAQILGIGDTFVQDIKTIGQLAEHNTKKMGTYEKQEKEYKHYESRTKGKIEIMKERGLIDKTTTVDDVRKENAKLTKINKMTPKQKKDYILYGKE